VKYSTYSHMFRISTLTSKNNRERFSFTTIRTEIIPLIFGGDLERSIPSVRKLFDIVFLPDDSNPNIVLFFAIYH
jgi:hypothetical protein